MYIEKLLGRTLLVYLKAEPAPATLRESLALHTLLVNMIGKQGSLIHYRQSICPVTKVRLPSIRALVEDNERNAEKHEQNHLLWSGVTPQGELTTLESKFLGINDTYKELRISALTRDLETINTVSRTGSNDDDPEIGVEDPQHPAQ